LALGAIHDQRTLVVGDNRHLPRIGIVVQAVASEHEMAQHAAEGEFEVFLVKVVRGRAIGKHGPLDKNGAIAEFRHAAEIMGRDQHDPAFVAQARSRR
jgi:hypothetical protein